MINQRSTVDSWTITAITVNKTSISVGKTSVPVGKTSISVSYTSISVINTIDKCSFVECFGDRDSKLTMRISSRVDDSGMSVVEFFKMILCTGKALGYNNRSADEYGTFLNDRSMVNDLDGS